MNNISISEICDLMEITYYIKIEDDGKKTLIMVKIKMGENMTTFYKYVDNLHLQFLTFQGKDINHIIKMMFQELINQLIPVDKIFENISWDNLKISK